MTVAGKRSRTYAGRRGAHLSREPVYLTRKRGAFVRLNVTLPRAVAIALREAVFEKGGTLSEQVEKALRKALGVHAS